MFPPGLPSPELMKDHQRFDISLRFQRLVDSLRELEALADAFSIPELKDTGRIHLSSVPVAVELKRATGSAVIPTITLRDSNRQGFIGLASFAIFSGLENLLLVRGDPYSGAENEPKNVYDFAKISSAVKRLRLLEAHLSGREKTCILAPLNLTKIGSSAYISTIRERESAGIDVFVTESLFEDTEKYLDRILKIRSLGVEAPIIHSIFPFRDYEDAVKCVQKFGWNVSERELHDLKTKGERAGVEMARERYFSLLDRKDVSQGVSISTRGDSELVRQIVS